LLRAERYRRTSRSIIGSKPLEPRRVAEGATTGAVKVRLLDDAGRCDELATQADRVEAEAEKR
jgi:hypothetical protein